MSWKLTRSATSSSPGTGSRSWRWYARVRGNRARTPRCCYRSYSRPRRQPRSAARGTRVCDDITRDTSTVISTRRRRTKYPDVASIMKALSTLCSKPCPNDKDQANERKVRFGRVISVDRQLSGRLEYCLNIESPSRRPTEWRFLLYAKTVLLSLLYLLCLTLPDHFEKIIHWSYWVS